MFLSRCAHTFEFGQTFGFGSRHDEHQCEKETKILHVRVCLLPRMKQFAIYVTLKYMLNLDAQ